MILLKRRPVKRVDGSTDESMFVVLPLSVHIGGGLWGIFAVPIFRRRIDPGPDGNSFPDRIFSIIYYITAGESWRVKIIDGGAIRFHACSSF